MALLPPRPGLVASAAVRNVGLPWTKYTGVDPGVRHDRQRTVGVQACSADLLPFRLNLS